jgi:predicted nucleic acid-binding protein
MMMLPDVNILVYAFRGESPGHEEYRTWLEGLINGREAYGLADLVCSGFLRVVTHPRTFGSPAPANLALECP